MLGWFTAHQCRCDIAIVLYSCPAVWASGICHIKYALWVTFNISRLTGLSYQQSNYPPPLFLRRETDAYVYISFHFYSYSIYITATCLYSVALIVGEYSCQIPPPIPMFAMPGTATVKGILIRAYIYYIFIHILL